MFPHEQVLYSAQVSVSTAATSTITTSAAAQQQQQRATGGGGGKAGGAPSSSASLQEPVLRFLHEAAAAAAGGGGQSELQRLSRALAKVSDKGAHLLSFPFLMGRAIPSKGLQGLELELSAPNS